MIMQTLLLFIVVICAFMLGYSVRSELEKHKERAKPSDEP